MSKLLTGLLLILPLAVFADMTFTGAKIYTLQNDEVAQTMCVAEGKVIGYKPCDSGPVINLSGQTVIPGFIEGHGHLTSMGYAKLNLDLTGAANYQGVVNRVAAAVDRAEPGDWILGRGWHQSKWVPKPELVDGFQTHHRLSEVSPDNPVFLVHASGHAAFANARAMEIAGITTETTSTGDGEVIKDESGEPTGVLNERAQSLVARYIPPPSDAQRERALELALLELAKNGVTSFQDAGSSDADIDLFKLFLKEKKLTSRVWVMLDGGDKELLRQWFAKGPEINLGDDQLTIRAVKLVADGALGSRGAWLLEPYSDMASTTGLPTMSPSYMSDVSHMAYQSGFQVGIHAIGDRANQEVLDIFDNLFDGEDRGVRFRIEHAQHIHPADIPRFGKLGVIASMQGIHMSSDRPWAIDRLGEERILSGAYMWRSLLNHDALIVNGTDAPVEPVNPIASFYSLVTRQTLSGNPQGGYEPEEKLTRMEALRSYTIDAAYGSFDEDIKGSLAIGKWADFVVLDQDILSVDDDQILDTSILMTVVGGEIIYQNPAL